MQKPNLLQSSLKCLSCSRIQEDVIKSTISRIHKEPLILILDSTSSYILSTFLTMTDLLNQGVFSIENLATKRQPFPQYHALYIITPSITSCQQIISDFSNSKKPMYKRVHIFFTHRIEDSTFDTLITKNLVNRVLTCKELNLSYHVRDKNLFHFNFSNNLFIFNKNHSNTQEYFAQINTIKEKLITVYSVLQQYPNIQYLKSSSICSKLALMINSELKQIFKNHPREGILLLTDRENDVVTPLLHDYNYQTMVHDLFQFKNGNEIHIGDKISILDNSDELWNKYKDKHLAQVFTQLSDDFDLFMKSDTGKVGTVSKENINSFENMEMCLKHMSGFKKKNMLFSLHLKISEEINRLYSINNLNKIIDLEQNIISGVNEEYKIIEPKDIIKEFTLLKHLLTTDNNNPHLHKNLLRLLGIIMCCLDISEKEFNVLINGINCNEKEMQIFLNMNNLGINFNASSNKKKCNRRNELPHKDEIKKMKQKLSQIEYKTIRSVPKLKPIVEQCANRTLNEEIFGFVEKMEKNDKGGKYGLKGLFGNNGNSDERDLNKENLVVFSVGGISYNEIASINELIHGGNVNYKVIIGSTGIYNGEEYLNELMNMNEIKKEGNIQKINDSNNCSNIQLDESDIRLEVGMLGKK